MTDTTTTITEVTPEKPRDQVAQSPASSATPATPKPVKPLTRKQQAFVQYLIDNPTSSAAEAVRHAYNLKDTSKANSTARTIAAENMAKPSVALELAKHSRTAELALLEVLQTSKDFSHQGNTAGASYAATAVSAANSILDRVHGKATQRIEQSSQAVTINIDLTAAT